MNKNIVFVAGGAWQKPFVQYLKNKGHYIAIVNPQVTETTQLADYHIKADVNDLDEINKHISQINPIFITSDQSDVSTLAVATLSAQWQLPCNKISVVEKFTNKLDMYKHSVATDISVPKTEIVTNTDSIINFSEKYGFPIIIKPVDGTMSRGFRKINFKHEITEALLSESLNFSKSKQVIVQNFIDGKMITLEGVCSKNKHKTIASSIKDDYLKPGITSGVRYPSQLPLKVLEKIIATNDKYVETAEMDFGLTHSEYIIKNDEYYLIEIGCRGGGAGITDKIVPWVSGINSYDILYDSLIGKTIDVKDLQILNRPALLKYYQAMEVENCNEEKAGQILKIPGVVEFHYNFIGKQYVKDDNDTRHSMGIYLAESQNDLNEIESHVVAILEG